MPKAKVKDEKVKSTKTVDKKKTIKEVKEKSTKTVDKKKTTSSKKPKVIEVKEKKSLRDRIMLFFVGLKKEFTRIHFPSKKNMVKYSIATIIFLLFFMGFFAVIYFLWIFIEGFM